MPLDKSIARIEPLHPILRARAKAFLEATEKAGILVLITEGLRPWDVQDSYYAKGRTAKSDIPCSHHGVARPVGTCDEHPLGATVTNAKGGDSMHQFALAFDAVPDDLSKDGFQPDWNLGHPAWRTMLALGKECKLAEGADWRTRPDNPHFYLVELPANPPQLLKVAYRRGGLQAAWQWANQYLKEAKQ